MPSSSCPSALTAPGPFDLSAPHLLPWLVIPLLITIPICILFGVIGTFLHVRRGVLEPGRRWFWWFTGLRDLCFTIGYPPLALVPVWEAALDAKKVTLAAQGCMLQGDGLGLVVPHTQDDFANWMIVGWFAISACLLLYVLLAFHERHIKLPGTLGRRLSGAVIFVITLAMVAETTLHGVALIQGTQLTSPLPRANNITEFALPKTQSLGEAPIEIAAGPDGNLWFTMNTDKIGRITPKGTVTEFALPASANWPGGIVSGADGNIWFAGPGDAIGRITSAGAVTLFALPRKGSAPSEIIAGPDGALWFTEFGRDSDTNQYAIGRITLAGVITEFSLPFSANAPAGIAVGPDENLWFTEAYTNTIGRITPAGVVTEFRLPTGASPPGLIAAGPDGALWFTEAAVKKIGRITTAGAVTFFPLPNGPGQPGAITAGLDGALWFTDPADLETSGDAIGRITPDGAVTLFPLGKAESELDGITAGPDGALWFIESLDNMIGRLTPEK